MTEKYFAPTGYVVVEPQVQDALAIGRLEANVYLGRHEAEQAAGLSLGTQFEMGRLQGEQHIADLQEDIRRCTALVREDPAAALWRIARTDDGAVVASLRASRAGSTVELLDIQVDPEYHGAGTAQELLGELFGWVELYNRGLVISVSADTQNSRAMSFYTKGGFRSVPGAGIKGGGTLRMVCAPNLERGFGDEV